MARGLRIGYPLPGSVSLTAEQGSYSLSGKAASLAKSAATDDLEADWQFRASGAGVVWFHDFRSDAEVDAFRWVGGLGNDPNDTQLPGRCIRNTTLGITGGGCLELIYRVGSQNAPGWWRPFGALSGSGNGKGVDDPGASGSLAVPLNAWDASNPGENEAYRKSYYAHPDQVGVAGWTADKFDGTEFFIQYRFRYTASRRDPSTPPAGKLAFIATTQSTLNQELVVMNNRSGLWQWYTNFGSSPDTGGALGISGGNKQPGGDFPSCDNSADSGLCYVYPTDEWVTLLIHVVPGHDGVKDTRLRAYVAEDGETSYRKIFDGLATINFTNPTGHPQGYNSFQPSNYMNGAASGVAWSQFYDQIIFSKLWIPPPGAKDSALGTAALALSPGGSADLTPNTGQDQNDVQWQLQTVFYDAYHRELQYMGKPASGQSSNYSHYLYSEALNQWTTIGRPVFTGIGHVWCATFDWDKGDYYATQYDSNTMRRFNRALGAWEDLATTGATTSGQDLNDGSIFAPMFGWHPNLFGQGKGGVYVHGAFRPFAYNPEINEFALLSTTSFPSGTPLRARNNGQALYLPAIDALVIWAQDGGSGENAIIVHAGAGASLNAMADGLIVTGGLPPITIDGAGGSTLHGHMVIHPDDPNRILCLEEKGAGRVWDSLDYGDSWNLKSYTHPFDDMLALNAGEFTVGTIAPYGVITAITSSPAGGGFRIWRPGD